MKYLILIYQNEQHLMALPHAELQEVQAEYAALTSELERAGQLVGKHRLQPTTMARTVRVREGKALTTDGPFAETKEQLGGYFLVEAPDVQAATEIAARIPSARGGSVEVRPVWV